MMVRAAAVVVEKNGQGRACVLKLAGEDGWMTTIPWREGAVLTKDRRGEMRSIIMEGRLEEVAQCLLHEHPRRDGLRVALPDRMIAPREWIGDDIDDLVQALRHRRL